MVLFYIKFFYNIKFAEKTGWSKLSHPRDIVVLRYKLGRDYGEVKGNVEVYSAGSGWSAFVNTGVKINDHFQTDTPSIQWTPMIGF